MKKPYVILILLLLTLLRPAISHSQNVHFDFYGDSINLSLDHTRFVDFTSPLGQSSIIRFNQQMNEAGYDEVVASLLAYKKQYLLDDWLYYQLIRKTAQQISPKADNYSRYTLYKWFFLTRSGYDAIVSIAGDRILFYVQSDENIYNIPYRMKNGKQYVCLNYHDYGSIDFASVHFDEVVIPVEGATRSFSYKVSHLPNFRPGDYLEKDIRFNYNQNDYYFKVKLNPAIKTLFANYPVVDYEYYFNIPLSTETYQSLIPILRKNVRHLNQKNGVEYLMKFTRYAFLFETDTNVFGSEKRLSPEQTLLYDQSDCEDRAALFFYLVKEIYGLPMIVLSYPAHVTVAVKLDKPVGKAIRYNGAQYTVCEPTPQKTDLNVGQLAPGLENQKYEIAYAFDPAIKKQPADEAAK